MKISLNELTKDSKTLAEKIRAGMGNDISANRVVVCGIPSGGLLPAYIVSEVLQLPLVDFSEIEKQEHIVIIVDDLVDSGKTMKDAVEKVKGAAVPAVLYRKTLSFDVQYFVTSFAEKEWLELPHESGSLGIEDNVKRILQFIGEDTNREGLADTPKRVAKMYKEIFRGYDDKQLPSVTVFPNGKDGITYDQMIIDSGDFYSQCEHHTAPFFGKYHFAYIPDENGLLLGLSKVARVVDHFSARLQIQERLGKNIVDYLEQSLSIEGVPAPKGLAIVLEGEHLCKSMRGVKKKGIMRTSYLTGSFKENIHTRQEFFNLIHHNK